MKTTNCRNRRGLFLIAACVCLGLYPANRAMSAETQSHRTQTAASAPVQSAKNSARLIVHRIPNMGRNVIVQLWIDDKPVASIPYGRTYDGILSPGRHVISVSPSPNAKWKTPSQKIIDVRQGQLYNFTAMSDGSGHLTLKGG